MESLFHPPSTSERVPLHTKKSVNEKILQDTIAVLDDIGADRAKIEARLRKIEREWDIERMIEAQASTVVMTGLTLGATRNQKWFFLPAVVAGFLFQHAVQGWCPPVPFLRRLGFRTQREIDNERIILMARLGQLDDLTKDARIALRTLAH